MINKDNIEIYHDYFITFYGRTPEYYINCLNSSLAGKKITFNFYAFIFGAIWLAYRKMYIEIFYMLLLDLFFGLIISILIQFKVISDSLSTDYQYLLLFIISVIIGFTANFFYVKKSIGIIEKNISQEKDPASTYQILKKKGGTSIPAVIIFILITLGLYIISISMNKNVL
jgi:hypothetical protein